MDKKRTNDYQDGRLYTQRSLGRLWSDCKASHLMKIRPQARHAERKISRFVAAPGKIQYLYGLVCQPMLLLDRLEYACDRRFKKASHFRAKVIQNKKSGRRWKVTHPNNFSCPYLIFDSGSLSRVEPNLMNCGSFLFLNLSLVELSNSWTIVSRSSRNAESERWSYKYFVSVREYDIVMCPTYSTKIRKPEGWQK